MVALSDPYYLAPEGYLQQEAQSTIKHEYINGKVFAMVGTDNHNTIALNLASLIRNHLRGTDCRVYFADLKVRLEKPNCFYYPDVFVTCDPRDRETSTYKRFPKFILEVLSDSTEAFDRGDKFNDYQTIESLQEYVLVNSKQQRVEVFRQDEDGIWLYQRYRPINQTIFFQSLDLTINFIDLYEDVDLVSPLNPDSVN
ncbi:MAG: Uma2 family endonuclease [Snowella sp.]|nr:Uma2 family endonuclease [Snowella sp.]